MKSSQSFKMTLLIIILVLSAFLVWKVIDSKTIVIDSGNSKHRFFVEIADEEEERRLGLMNRKHLEENQGMLFVFDKEQPLAFWMKNVWIPLDMIFISSNGEIVDIKKAIPCEPIERGPCINYEPQKPAQYVLEIYGDLSEKLEINIGNRVTGI